MQISTMGDIGGIRIITKNMRHVQAISNSLINGHSRNKLLGQKDYLTYPKESGYRGLHLTYSYQGAKHEYQGFRVELQIRSQIQHAWATAVEVVGTFLQQNLKVGQGSNAWLQFFQQISLAFACVETKQEIDKAIKERINSQVKDLKAFDVLMSFSITARHSGKKDGFYLLQLDITESQISIRYFESSFLPDAYNEYRRIEQEISEDNKKDVVLVSAASLTELKKAYPNYFADTALFLNHLQKALNSGDKI